MTGPDQTDISLRTMTVDDLMDVARLGISSKASWGYSSDMMVVFSKELTLDATILHELLAAQVACRSEKTLGYFTMRKHSDGVSELEHLFIHPDHFGQGIGSKLLHAVFAVAVNNGTRKLTVIADPHSVAFYGRFGAHQVGEHQSGIAGRKLPILEIELENPP